MKKKREVKLRHFIITRLAYPILWFFFVRPFRIKIIKDERIKKLKGPYLVLANHTINHDPIILGFHFPKNLYYIATEQIFNLGFLSKLLVFAVNPIKKTKSVSDLGTIKMIKRVTNEGGSIGVYPEGNTTYTGETAQINIAIVKLIKMLKLPVVIINTKGLYLSFPRWSVYPKKGKTTSFVRSLYLPEKIIDYSETELYEIIKNDLYVNAYQDQENDQDLYRGKKIAHGLERLIFIDLLKNIPFVTYSENNKLKSTASDFELTYQENGKVLTTDNQEKTLIEVDKEVKLAYFDFYKNYTSNKLYEESVVVTETFSNKKIKLGEARCFLNKDSIVLYFKDRDINLYYNDINSMAIQGKKQIIVYLNYQTYLIGLDDYASPYKYILTYQFYKYLQIGGVSINDKLSEFGI